MATMRIAASAYITKVAAKGTLQSGWYSRFSI